MATINAPVFILKYINSTDHTSSSIVRQRVYVSPIRNATTYPHALWIQWFQTSIYARRRQPSDPDYGTGGDIVTPPDPGTGVGVGGARASLCEAMRIGVQPDFLTLANSSIRINAWDIESKPAIRRETRKICLQSTGQKAVKYRESASGNLTGYLSYTDIVYLLSMSLCKPSLQQISGNVHTYTFVPKSDRKNNLNVLTVERGGTSLLSRSACVQLNSFGFSVNDTDCTISGNTVGTKTADVDTASTVVYDIPDKPIHPGDFNIYIGTDLNNLTLLGGCTKLGFNLEDIATPRWVSSSIPTSYSSLRQSSGTKSFTISIVHNSESYAFIESMRNGDLLFLYIDAQGDQLLPSTFERLSIIAPFRFIDTDRSDNEGSYEAEYTLEPIYDADFGSWIKVIVTNDLIRVKALELSI